MRADSATRPSMQVRQSPVLHQRQAAQSAERKTQVSTTTKSKTKHSFGKTYSDDGALMYLDAGIRGALRYLENAKFAGTAYRVPFRAAAELVRHTTSGTLNEMLQDNKVTKKVLMPALRKSLENTLATTVFEPARFENRFVKMGVGFANMIVRVGARVMLAAMDIIEPGDLDLENAADDFAGRSLLRGFWFDTQGPLGGILVPTIEQLGINKITHYLPIKNILVPKIKGEPSQNALKSTVAPALSA